jgi:hypothetical protein
MIRITEGKVIVEIETDEPDVLLKDLKEAVTYIVAFQKEDFLLSSYEDMQTALFFLRELF